MAVDDMRIATALANDFEYRSYDEIGIERSDAFEMRIKNICGLLVTIDNGSVFLIHQTAKEFLIQEDDMSHKSDTWKHSFDPLDSETLLGKICISLLSFTCFSEAPLTIDDDDDESHKTVSEYAKNNPFLGYAATKWTEHCQEANLDNNPEWMSSIMSLCSVNNPAFRTWYAVHLHLGKTHLPWKMTSLNVAAQFGFPNALASLLEFGEDPNEPDGHGATPLARAMKKPGMAVDLLLNAKADINAYSWKEPWYDEVRDTGSEIEFKPLSGTPLVMAVNNQDPEMVKYLIERGAEINFPPHGFLTPLSAACLQCASGTRPEAKEILQVLLRSGANVCFEMEDEDLPIAVTALHAAAVNKDPWMLHVLLGSESADVNFQLRDSPNNVRMEGQDTINGPKISSVEIRSSQVVSSSASVPSACRRDINGSREDEDSNKGGEIDDNNFIPSNQNSDDDSGSSFNLRSDQSDFSEWGDSSQDYDFMIGATPLHLAAGGGLLENVKLLLERGADPHIQNADGYTAMDFADELTSIDGIDDEEAFNSTKAELELIITRSQISCPSALVSDEKSQPLGPERI